MTETSTKVSLSTIGKHSRRGDKQWMRHNHRRTDNFGHGVCFFFAPADDLPMFSEQRYGLAITAIPAIPAIRAIPAIPRAMLGSYTNITM